jgi:hypothetical protein
MLLCSVGTLQRLQIQNVETFPLSRAFPPLESCSAFAAAREWARSRLSCKLKRNDLDRWQIFLLSLYFSPPLAGNVHSCQVKGLFVCDPFVRERAAGECFVLFFCIRDAH